MADTGLISLPQPLGALGRQLALGFAYWLAFDLVLEPGNLAQAARRGASMAWDQEAIRLAGAGLLGAAAAPLVFALVRRFPIEGPARWRRGAVHAVSSAGLSAALIALSCPLAAWLLASERRPLAQALRDELGANLLLLTFCMAGFVAIAHSWRYGHAIPAIRAPTPPSATQTRIAVKTRSGVLMVPAADIDWIETQGNYVALHVGLRTHLIRDTLQRFEAGLEPGRFVRVHRRTIVAFDRVVELTALGSGDATIRLVTGAELRVSRGYRQQLGSRMNGSPPPVS